MSHRTLGGPDARAAKKNMDLRLNFTSIFIGKMADMTSIA
jgi:hypothetical protein